VSYIKALLKSLVEIFAGEVVGGDSGGSSSGGEENVEEFWEGGVVEVVDKLLVISWGELVPEVLVFESDDEFVDEWVSESVVLLSRLLGASTGPDSDGSRLASEA